MQISSIYKIIDIKLPILNTNVGIEKMVFKVKDFIKHILVSIFNTEVK